MTEPVQTPDSPPRPAKISALIADVDGTLVTKDKGLAPSTIAAVARLRDAGITFAVVSSRPPRGLQSLIAPLNLSMPMAGFNGGMITRPDLSVIAHHFVPADIARRAVELMSAHGVEVWVYNGQDWLVRDLDGAHVGHEQHTLNFAPTLVKDFGTDFAAVGKIVGVSDDEALLTGCESEVRAALGDAASVERSQRYYLDITHPLANKGAAAPALAKLMGVAMEETAVIGDGYNDVAMFARSPLSIAMGNAAPEVQARARYVTAGNMDDGFAKAVETYLLSRRATGEAA